MAQRLAWEKPMLRKPKNAFFLLLEEGGPGFCQAGELPDVPVMPKPIHSLAQGLLDRTRIIPQYAPCLIR